jgi:glutamyl-tRNA(Gln) amidotransferase subunit D
VGGTIVNKVDYSTGAVATKISPEEFLERVPGLEGVANIEYRKIANIASEDLRFGHYNLIAREVMKEVERGAKGVVITHGTDTMHFTSAAMSFILGGIKAPVILVGAQRSGDRGSSDGIMNLACAVNFIVKSEFNGVGICMHKDMGDEACVILPGVKARKMHTSRRDAFRAINSEPIAEVSREGKVSIIGGWKGGGEEKARWFKEGIKVGIVRAHTNLFPENISCFKGYKGLILEGTGLGHFPAKKYDKESSINAKIGEEIESLAREGCVVGITSQCVFGRVNLKVYTPQRELEARGVIGCEDMTTETAFIKLAWLLSNFKPKEAKEKMVENLRGEISQKSEIKKDFLE